MRLTESGCPSDDGFIDGAVLPGPTGTFLLHRTQRGIHAPNAECPFSFCPAIENSCRHRTGPFSGGCLEMLWQRAGCFLEGLGSPRHATAEQLDYWHKQTLEYVLWDMAWYKKRALDGQGNYPTTCFGAEFDGQKISKTPHLHRVDPLFLDPPSRQAHTSVEQLLEHQQNEYVYSLI
eukprot:m.98829 g.98829  ORF g.98829 m.98829 type:complete len:177 (-) comp8871_c0_seq5:147-677(-)